MEEIVFYKIGGTQIKKLIAIDLDGTLLNSYGEISKEDKNAVKKQIKNGAEVVLTSGRTVSAMENFAEVANFITTDNNSGVGKALEIIG